MKEGGGVRYGMGAALDNLSVGGWEDMIYTWVSTYLLSMNKSYRYDFLI